MEHRRAHERFRLGGLARLVFDHPAGLVTATGRLVDLSEGGCQLRFHAHVAANLAARVRIDVAGETFWLPVLTRWVRRERGRMDRRLRLRPAHSREAAGDTSPAPAR